MDKIVIQGGTPLFGSIRISGAKNAALPLMTAALLTEETLQLHNMAQLADIYTLGEILESVGTQVSFEKDADGALICQLTAKTITSPEAHYELVRKMRASVLVLGPLVARHGHARVSLPGGCAIGARPIDLHLKGLEKLGAEIVLEAGYVDAKAPLGGLKGADFSFPMVSVTGTENIMMAACLAKGTTRLFNAACEPEVVDLGRCLQAMGAQIEGLGTNTLIIHGVERLKAATHRVLPDRIETGTYAIAAAITGGRVELTHTSMDLLPTFTEILQQAGCDLTATAAGFMVAAPQGPIHALDASTEPFPGFATDLQAQLMALMTVASGASIIDENIFENRFMHVPELCRMGADITVRGNTAFVRGVKTLKGAPVMATDLRASSSLILAGLRAEGETIVNRVYHLDRGYERIEDKLGACGAMIQRVKEPVNKDTKQAETTAVA